MDKTQIILYLYSLQHSIKHCKDKEKVCKLRNMRDSILSKIRVA